MFSKVVILLVCLSVVKATVFTVNANEDENNEIDNLSEDAVARSARTCFNSQCHRVCRRLGHVRGFCVSPNVCRCRGRLGRSAAFDAEEVSDPEVAEISNVADESAVRTLRSCGYAECNAFCRKLGYARGVCIGTYCQCRMRSAAAAVEIPKPVTVKAAVETESRSFCNCNIKECNKYCRKRGFVRGVCIGTYCQCRIFLANKPLTGASEEIPEALVLKSLRSASPLSESDFESDESEIAEPLRLRKALRFCNLRACEQSCRRIGLLGGVCVNFRCKCSIRRPSALPTSTLTASEDNNDEIASDANPEDDATAGGDNDSSENSVY